jgi:Glycosyltransferase family 10 (fucosyltransferase) C-term
MTKGKSIVCVSSSFEQKEELLKTIKKYAQFCDERFAYWDEFAFTTEILPECDALLVLNTPGEKIYTSCYPEKVIGFMMEPGVAIEHPWMFKRLEQYHHVYSPTQQSENTILSHGFAGWYFKQDYTYLKKLPPPVKSKSISCIASNLKQLEGHRLRIAFVKKLRQQMPQIEFFGKGTHFLTDKMDGLIPYRYSIAIENSSQPFYFTEKINDCFLAYTVPVYYGCKNISRYFPERSYIQIDIENPERALKKIASLINEDDWQSRLEAVKEARELVLDKYQPLAGAVAILRHIQPALGKKEILVEPVHHSLLKKIKTTLSKMIITKENHYP